VLRLTAAVAAAAALTLAACTSSTSGTPTSPPSTGSASGSSSTAASSSAAPTSAAKARAALITTADVGPGFVKQPFPGGSDTDATSPCLPAGSPSLDTKYPPAARARTGFRSNAPQALLGEQVALYRDAATARRVVAYAQRALRCRNATVGGQRVQIHATPPVRQIGGQRVDSAQTWALKVGPAAAALVAVRLGNAVMSMEFIALSSTDVRKLPQQDLVVGRAVKRAKAAL
jgi:lipoprotein-anchoring transpeptidase ErfK/SrfK